MKSMIVETCFVEATEDVALYKKLGPDAIGKTIAEAISNKTTNTKLDNNTNESTPVVNNKPTSTGDDWVRRLQQECNNQGFSKQVVDGIPGPATLAGCPIIKIGAKGNITKLLQEKLGISADGIFGTNTKAAVISYQKANGLSADGIVGQNTWRKLLNL